MKLVKYLAIVIISSLLLTAVSSRLANKGLRKSSVDFFGKMNAAGNGAVKSEILLVGSSRVLVQIDPRIVDSVTGMQSYNYGLNSMGIRTCSNLITSAVENHPESKLIVLNIDYFMFDVAEDPYKDPFYYAFENKAQNNFLFSDLKLNFFHKAGIFDIAMYDDMAKYAALSGLISPNKIIAGMYKGYLPNVTDKGFKEPPASIFSKKKEVVFTKEGTGILQKIIDFCAKKQKKLVLITAPYPDGYLPDRYISNYRAVTDNIKAMAAVNNIPYQNYSDSIKDHRFFYDKLHLNVTGAGIYSTMLSRDLKKITDSLK